MSVVVRVDDVVAVFSPQVSSVGGGVVPWIDIAWVFDAPGHFVLGVDVPTDNRYRVIGVDIGRTASESSNLIVD